MTHGSLLNEFWQAALTRLGGTAAIEACARGKKAFLRGRRVACATGLLRLILAYCPGGMGLRLVPVKTGIGERMGWPHFRRHRILKDCGARAPEAGSGDPAANRRSCLA
jgi:hypothetical protein